MPTERRGGWFRPVGVDLSARPPQRTPPVIPPPAQAAVGRGARFLAILAVLAALLVVAGAVLLVVAAQPVAALAWLVGGLVLGWLIRIAWRTSR